MEAKPTRKPVIITAVALLLTVLLAVPFAVNNFGSSKVAEGLIGEGYTRDLASAESGILYYDDEAIGKYIGVPLAGDIKDSDPALQQLIADTCAKVNEVRTSNGLSAVKIVDVGALADAAVVRANECYIKWSHTRPNGMEWYTVNSDVQWGENLAYGYSNANSVVDAWMASPTHKANILCGDFKQMSIKIYVRDGVYYWAQEFDY